MYDELWLEMYKLWLEEYLDEIFGKAVMEEAQIERDLGDDY